MTELLAYFERVGFTGTARPDLATLRELHRRHVEAIPFEGLDAQLGIVPSMETPAIFGKLVRQRRGGWCYEMNGLFGWVLEQIGFSVTRLSCGVMRHVAGAERDDTHLALLVPIDGVPWLADVGFGSSLVGPLPLATADHSHLPFAVGLTEVAENAWRFTEHSGAEPFSFDFTVAPADEARLAAKCAWQATAPQSTFTQNFVAMKRRADRHLSLRGRVLTELSVDGASKHIVADEVEFEAVLRERFGIEHPHVRSLWPGIVTRHEALFPAAA